ncbi:olfactory receptor 14I1-like [Cariama cristata]
MILVEMNKKITLHNPMHFFLMNLSISDLDSISVLVLKSMANSILNTRSISCSGYVVQVFVFIFFTPPHFAILTVMTCMGSTAYMKPISTFSSALAPIIAVLYSVLPPILNPAIYSMQNKEIKGAVRKLIKRHL